MSLLMKALEKAAKDRGETRPEPPAPTGGGEPKPELSLALELLAADTPSPRLKEEVSPQSGAAQHAYSGAPSREQTRAATVMQAGGGAIGSVGDYVRSHPVLVFGILAALFAISFSTYVYLQIYHPGFFVRQSPPTKTLPPLAQAPPPAPGATSPPATTASILESTTPAAVPQPPAIPVAPAAPPKPAAAVAPQKPERGTRRDTIIVSRGADAPRVNPALTEAYAALQAGRLENAQRLYSQIVHAEPKNVDALLGLASIALQQGRAEEATQHYFAILELDPRNAFAQSGLIGLMGRADPLAAETRLKELIAREPSAFLYFTLGNLYAEQSLWAQAQQAYFQAHHLEPDNPDYIYNLAVGLEHLGQHKLALDFYRRALERASASGRANFDRTLTEERIAKLASQMN